jgi:hypothetical protein
LSVRLLIRPSTPALRTSAANVSRYVVTRLTPPTVTSYTFQASFVLAML